jgi:HEAT repeat protein
VRFAILEALGEIGGEKAKQALQLTIDSDNEAEAEIAELAMEQLYAGVNNLSELIDEVLGVKPDEDAAEEDETLGVWDDFYEDPLNAEIRRLIDGGDDHY